MKKASTSQMIEAECTHHTNPGNLGNEKTEKEFEKREIAEALAHIYGYG
ncbi:MAG: hypothetical protein P0116_06640 [Candidatus Nitrosocosmicus sp.]|nr:hypothetical protein [Candidatus Nitrosocosmicus sp.]